MKQFKIVLILAALIGSITESRAQLVIEADIRPRFEYRHGFGNLFPDDAEPAAFVQQRSRLNVAYGMGKISLMLSVQDVSVWGDTPQIAVGDSNNSFSLFQAWINYEFNDKWSTKLGRQVLSYDDQRILGGLDWAMQGRTHDALLLKYKNAASKLDIGVAFNQENLRNEGNAFFIQNAFSYKSMLYAHFNTKLNKLDVSVLLLNNGFQNTRLVNDVLDDDGVSYRHTFGTYLKYPVNKLNLSGSFYYQFGEVNSNTDLNAYQLLLEANYKPNKTLFGLGYEILSGTDQNTTDSTNKSFFPLYGTNHKFNGFMDYFYVGNHANNVGLNDLYAKVNFKLNAKSNLLVKGHYFAANADLANDADKYLGTEFDVVYTRKPLKNVTLNIGVFSYVCLGKYEFD